MRRKKEIVQAAGAALIAASLLAAGSPAAAGAEAANGPSLVISQLKITSGNGQFITLYNTSDGTLDMAKYRLEYFNNFDLGKVTSSRLINLSGSLPPHSYFMVNDDSLTLCYRLTVDSVSLGFSSTAGMVEVSAISQAQPGGQVGPVLQDYVGWSKTAATGAQTLPSNTSAFLERRPVDGLNSPDVIMAGAGSWQAVQPNPANPCDLIGVGTTNSVPTGLSELLPSSEPPATILALDNSTPNPASLPPADIGLKAPVITELLPNPAGTGNDSRDEFIELYNPNDTVFDLSVFSLQAGKRAYNFPAGTNLPPRGFQAFYASVTGLSLSNSGGLAKLLDPFGNSISASGTYGSAKDGQAWALADGKWYWTTKLTPAAANVINQPPTVKKAAKKSSKKSAKTAVKTKSKKTKTATLAANHTSDSQAPSTPIHAWSLALVAIAAILYGAYEYREDIKNRVYEFRGNLRARREGRA